MRERRYLSVCPGCGNERQLARSAVLTGKIPVCDGDECRQYMNVYAIDPRPPAPPRPRGAETLAREVS